MRVAFLTWSSRVVGGAERYIRVAASELLARGHEVAVCYEMDEPSDRASLLPSGTTSWCVAELGRERAVAALRAWGPDVVYTQQVLDPVLEAEVQRVAPSVLFTHGYAGTCISGAKTNKFPAVRPCGQRFGAGCLVRYFPNRCGGLSPLTMLRDFRTQVARNELLSGYRAIVTNSRHLRAEYARYVDEPERVHCIPLPVGDGGEPGNPGGAVSRLAPRGDEPWSLLFVGRMDRLKGGLVLLEALPRVVAALNRSLELTLAGDGPDRARWEAAADRIQWREPRIAVRFTGWLEQEELDREWERSHLLVVPSLWPEPFGLVGPEAARRGIPAAGFAVGGIPDWLEDGRSGALAPADPPRAEGLAEAIVRCLAEPDRYSALSRGALEVGYRYDRERHFAALLELLTSVATTTEDLSLHA